MKLFVGVGLTSTAERTERIGSYDGCISKAPRHLTVLIGLFVAALSSILIKGFGTVVLLSQALLLWPWIPYAKRGGTRAILLIGGSAVFIMLLIRFGQLIYFGPLILWYLLLGIAYGQFKLMGNLIFSLVASVMAYILIHYVLTTRKA